MQCTKDRSAYRCTAVEAYAAHLAHCSTHLPEVANFQVAVLVAENVLGLYVAVHDVVLVQALQRFADLCCDGNSTGTQTAKTVEAKTAASSPDVAQWVGSSPHPTAEVGRHSREQSVLAVSGTLEV